MASAVTREDLQAWIHQSRYLHYRLPFFLVSASVLDTANICHQQNIASKGGKMSGGNQQQEDNQGITEFGQRRSSKYHYTSDELYQPEE